MMPDVEMKLEGTTLVLCIPMRFQCRGGRKRIVAPDGSAIVPGSQPQSDGTLVKALARAWRWQRMLGSGEYATLAELADAERISRSYVCRVMRLMLLAPDIIERIFDGRPTAKLEPFLKPFPVEWKRQREQFLCRGLGHSKEELQSIKEELQTVNRHGRSRTADPEHAVIREPMIKGTAAWRHPREQRRDHGAARASVGRSRNGAARQVRRAYVTEVVL